MIFYVLWENPSLLWECTFREGMRFCKSEARQKKQANKIFSVEPKYDMKSQRLIGTIFARPTQTLSVNFLDPSAMKCLYVEAALKLL